MVHTGRVAETMEDEMADGGNRNPAELPTVEYSVRTAQTAVFGLLSVAREVTRRRQSDTWPTSHTIQWFTSIFCRASFSRT